MHSRQAAGRDPAIRELLSKKFVPCTDDVFCIQAGTGNGSSAEALMFQKMTKDIKRTAGVDKGFYLFTPSGIPLVRWTCHRGAEVDRSGGVEPDPDGKPIKVKNQLEGIQLALQRYEKIPKEERLLPQNARIGSSARSALPMATSEGTLCLRMLTRNLPPNAGQLAVEAAKKAQGKIDRQTWRWNIHWLTVPAQDFLPTPLEVKASKDVSAAFMKTLCSEHFVDSTCGQSGHLVPKSVKSAWMRSKVVKVEGSIVTLSLEGETDADNYASKILGRAVWDGRKFTAFEFLAAGIREGENHSPMGFFFEYVPDGPIWHLKNPPRGTATAPPK